MAGVAALVAVVVVATTVAIMVFAFPASINYSPPNVKFVEFTFDKKQDIKVGESLKVFFNVVNHESRTFNDVRVVVFIEPSSSSSSSYQPYIS